MEIEYKWKLAAADTAEALVASELVAPCMRDEERIEMHARYFDTASGLLSQRRSGLRIRRENEESVCCLKTPAEDPQATKARNEYEVAADDIVEGLKALPSAGAPRDLCELVLAEGAEVVCETIFTRRAITLLLGTGEGACTAELAVDKGCMRRHGNEAPISELELEFKDGCSATFHSFAHELQETFSLVEQALPKLARAMAL